MQLFIVLLIAAAAGLTGIAVGWFLRFIIALGKRGSMELEIKEMLLSAREEAEEITSEAEDKAEAIIKEAKTEIKKQEEELQKTKNRLINKEDLLDRRQTDLDQESENIKNKEEQIKTLEAQLQQKIADQVEALSKTSSLSKEEARDLLLEKIESEYEEDLLVRLQKIESVNKSKIEEKARDIMLSAIERLGVSVSSNLFSSVIDLPSDEIKGKIIGKEGRNIRTFERETGVELIIDDTPGVITLSSYDPIRREVAKIALENLIEDGRIQPVKIEQFISKAKEEVQKVIKERGEQAAYQCGIYNLNPKVLMILGRLHYRTSYGQNVLQHSIEMAHLSAMMAEEIGADVKVAKTGALLHDIGKAVDHEITGSHVEIGRRILQKFGVDEEVIKAMQSHHEDYPFENPESVIVFVADAISGGRPGARSDNAENYLKRLEDLEAIANSFDGIEKTYAVQAGREIRIFVRPEEIGDLEAQKMAKNIAKKVEEELKYPGEIKVTVIRENRITQYAR
jgi:ribonuclease Y